jgi:hypothetical protein
MQVCMGTGAYPDDPGARDPMIAWSRRLPRATRLKSRLVTRAIRHGNDPCRTPQPRLRLAGDVFLDGDELPGLDEIRLREDDGDERGEGSQILDQGDILL